MQELRAVLQPSIATNATADYVRWVTSQGRVASRPGLRWDGYDAYLFDIDGTLVRDPSRVHYYAFSLACQEVLGHPLSLEAVHVAGSTDPRILRDAFFAAGIADGHWRPHQPRLLEAISSSVARNAHSMQIRVMPGVVDMLQALRSRGKLLGVATGNLEAIGWLKLQHAELRDFFTFGGFSDDHEERAGMIAATAAAASQLAGAGAALAVVGDTPSDIAAARANNIPVIAVATGHSTFDQLLEHEPEICAENLSALLLAGAEP